MNSVLKFKKTYSQDEVSRVVAENAYLHHENSKLLERNQELLKREVLWKELSVKQKHINTQQEEALNEAMDGLKKMVLRAEEMDRNFHKSLDNCFNKLV